MSPSDFVQRGLLLVERGQYQEAVKTCRLGLLGRPGAIEGRIVLGRALLALGRFDEVLTEMRVALDAMPSFALAHMLRGEALLGKGDVAGARSSLRLAAVLAPDDPEIAGKVRTAEAAPPPRHPAPAADPTETKHYLRAAAGSAPDIYPARDTFDDDEGIGHAGDEDTATDDSPTTLHAAAAPSSPPAARGPAPAAARGSAPIPAPGAAPGPRRSAPGAAAPVRDEIGAPDEISTRTATAVAGSIEGKSASLIDAHEVVPRDVFEESPTSVHVDEEMGAQHDTLLEMQAETAIRAPLRAAGTPVYGEAQARGGLFPLPEESAERRGPAEETLLTVPLSPQLNPVHSTANGRTSIVAKKKNTEPLGDDALVEIPSGPGGGYATARPPRLPNPPSQPPAPPSRPSGRAPGNSQPPPRPPASQPPRSSRSSAPPPIPGAPPPSGPSWQRPEAPPPAPPGNPAGRPSAQQPTMLAAPAATGGGRPSAQHAAVPPAQQPTMLARPAPQLPPQAAPPPQQQQAAPMGPQRAGAFQAYQTAIAAQPPQLPGAPLGAPMGQGMQDAVPAAAAPAPAKSAKPKAAGKSRRKRRTGLATALWVLVGAGVIGGGVFAGLQIRDLRLRRQIDAAEKRAVEASSSDTWLGWRTARDGLASIAAARRTPEARAALARAQAVLAFELGDGAAEASAILRPLGADARTAVARAYMALIAGDVAAAGREVGLISGESPAVTEYLRGRVALLAGDAKTAIAALEKSHRADPRPFTTAALAEAYSAADRWDDARKLLDAGLAKLADHPTLIIARAELADRLGKHTPASSAEEVARLEKLVAEAQKPLASQARGVSPWQAANALLVEAGVQLRRGERDPALASIARALELNIDEQRLAEASVSALLGADLPEVAAAGAKRGLTSWPQSMVLRTVQAQGSFAEGRMNEVIEALPDALIGKDPLALALRARARLSIGDLEGARKDLDLVSAASTPELLVARALLKLASGETLPPAAAPSPRPDLALVQATAARLRGDPSAALAILEPISRGPMGAERTSIRLELARSYRDAANYASARAAYAALAPLNNPAVRLEAAQLLLEDRDPKGAREHIEALLRDLGDKASGLVLVEAMRIRTLTGAATAAESLADRAFKAGAPPWMLQREAARIARRREDFAGAIVALGKALDGSKADIDTILLGCDLVDGAPAAFVAKVTKAVEERLVGLPDQLVAQGKLAIARQDLTKAAELFTKASQRFQERPASARRVAQASFGVGALAVGRGDWVMAKLKLEAALELDPALVDAYLYQAVALAASNALKPAIARLKVASEYSPESIVVWQLLERRATEAGDRKTAEQAAKRVQELQAKKPT